MSPLCSGSHAQEASRPARVYRRRRPERTAVYQVVQEHLETWLAHYNEAEPESNPVPHYIERDLRKFLECGILAHGFARAYCDHCGRDFLIAYSCKGRGICSSCNSKRMAAVAAHLVDEVFPCVPVRKQVTACAGLPIGKQAPQKNAREAAQGVSASLWAMLPARIYEVFPLICPCCGSELRILAFVTNSSSISTILTHLGLPAQPPRVARARAPPWKIPAEDFNQDISDPQTLSQEPPEFEYDQRINW